MKKTLFFISSFILIFNVVSAQKLDWQERRKVADQIDELIENYINNCELTELGGTEYSPEKVQAFKDLFVEGAKITDEVAIQRTEDGGGELKEQNIDQYTADLMERYGQGMTIKVSKLQADYSELDKRKAKVFMERQFRAKKEKGGYYLKTSDVTLNLEMDRELNYVKISNLTTEPIKPPIPENEAPIAKNIDIKVKSGETISINLNDSCKDSDGDKLTYTKVSGPSKGTLKTNANGRWTYTANEITEATSDQFTYKVCDTKKACIEAKVNISIEEKDKDGRGLYIDLIAGLGRSSFDAGGVEFDYGINRGVTENAIAGSGGSGISFGAEVDYFFTNNIGIGAGILFNRMGGKFDVNNFEARYWSDAYNGVSGQDYERVVSIANLTEEYTVTNIGIPLLLKFKTDINDKIGVFANLGILYNLSSSAKSTFGGGTIDYEAIYYSADGVNYGYDNTNANPIHNDTLNRGNVRMFQDPTLNLGTDIEAVSMDDKIDFSSHIGLLGRIGVTFSLSDKMSVLLGGQYTSGSLSSGNTDGYRITDLINSEGKGEYNSPLNGGAGYSNFGLNIGLSFKL